MELAGPLPLEAILESMCVRVESLIQVVESSQGSRSWIRSVL